MRKFNFFVLLFSILLISGANASVVKEILPSSNLIGQGNFKYLAWNVYDASLYSSTKQWDPNQKFALSLEYKLNLKGKDIARTSIEQIQKLGFKNQQKLNRWEQQMANIFPDVKKGTVLTGVRTKNGTATFYNGSKKIGTINDAEFAKWFFAIWLDENTSAPKLRRQLLGIR